MADQPRMTAPIAGATKRSFPEQGVPVIHRVNWIGLKTLYMKEVRRFFKVQTQTIWAPAITTLLQLVIFTLALGGAGARCWACHFATFVAPGLIVMGMMQNAFQNASFAFLSGKMQGTIVDYLMPPLSEGELMLAMTAAAVTRGVLVGVALALIMSFWPGVSLAVAHPWAVVWFGLMGAVFLAFFGLLSSIWAEKFDHNAAITNFFVTPADHAVGHFLRHRQSARGFPAGQPGQPVLLRHLGLPLRLHRPERYRQHQQRCCTARSGMGLFNLVLGAVAYFVLKSGWRLKS